ncbi:MAG: hypothetical protein AAF206_05450 [Bacteroidota bacterium]
MLGDLEGVHYSMTGQKELEADANSDTNVVREEVDQLTSELKQVSSISQAKKLGSSIKHGIFPSLLNFFRRRKRRNFLRGGKDQFDANIDRVNQLISEACYDQNQSYYDYQASRQESYASQTNQSPEKARGVLKETKETNVRIKS